MDKKSLEQIERIVYKNSDDIAVSIARSFERLEERIDAMEARIYSRIGDIEDRQMGDVADIFDGLEKLETIIKSK